MGDYCLIRGLFGRAAVLGNVMCSVPATQKMLCFFYFTQPHDTVPKESDIWRPLQDVDITKNTKTLRLNEEAFPEQLACYSDRAFML